MADLKLVERNLIVPCLSMPMVAVGRISRWVRDLLWIMRPWMIRGRVLLSVLVGGSLAVPAVYAGGDVASVISSFVFLGERNRERDGQRMVIGCFQHLMFVANSSDEVGDCFYFFLRPEGFRTYLDFPLNVTNY